MLPTHWEKILDKLDFAFQPIVYTTTGNIFGVEALLRNVDEAGKFNAIYELFDAAYSEGVLYKLDIELRRKALKKFSKIDVKNLTLFYNLDNRLMKMSDYCTGNTTKILQDLNIKQKYLCFEISERGSIDNPHEFNNIINLYKSEGFNIAIDDYGTGISGLKMLYYSEPSFIKLDRFFINGIEKDFKKKHFCSTIVDMAHAIGMKVIAEGVETKKEYLTSKDIGCDMIQGYFVQKPTKKTDEILFTYSDLAKLVKKDRRTDTVDKEIDKHLEIPKPLNHNATMKELFNYFKKNKKNIFVPLIDDRGHLTGVIYEEDIKHISYSQYGMALSQNTLFNKKLKNFIKEAVSVEISWGVDKVIERYSNNQSNNRGIFITKNDMYHGFISLNNLLQIIYKRNIFIAKNQNPLTKLPGNIYIEEFISNSFTKNSKDNTHLIYLDFNDFKPFNDYYGFRKGDRVIILFSEILQKRLGKDTFIGHVGGDDYFVGFRGKKIEDVYTIVKDIQKDFKNDVLAFYSRDDLDNGFIEIADRHGVKRKFHTMSVACAILEVTQSSKIEYLDDTLAMIKKMSKKSKKPIAFSLTTGQELEF